MTETGTGDQTKVKEIERKCIVCGKRLKIGLLKDGSYTGGYYFGRITIPVGEGEHRKVGRSKIVDMEVDVVEWTGEHLETEYWECDECFHEE
ncbi:MAG: hypothetical protein JW939_06380 [Candidatus Thermoplasmatota archaeon]|nr:hypothetical protein [Candidatus Thermoplasmatota archaeon]